ncbi:hypothetical protein GYMLUDRAFT_263096 [Collybiopsis luxurians FD-317 M1]|uniref:Uncharacterized protein n=1 Tax=Collybiopsis luxurians FD-317 M1 TaxID=944289 RepID=A0A0D0CGK9_9AGAR|nr:hypothetical protein GYMLUDRAFT_263096 [Collybiopsis luxurians FD-317 M1]
MSLPLEQVDAVRQILQQTADYRVGPLLLETALWGNLYSPEWFCESEIDDSPLAIFTILISASSYIIMGLQARSKKVMLILTLFMYILSTLDWAIDVRRVWTDLKISIPAELDSPPPDESKLNTTNVLIRIIQAITNNICVILSDMVVCWRVCVVYKWDKRVTATAVVFLIVLSGLIFLCNLTQIGVGFPRITHLHVLQSSQLVIDVIALTCSALINVWATGMVALRAWRCRSGIHLHLANSDRRSYTESVLTLFVESGIIYTVLWIGKNIIIIPGVADTSYTNYAIFTMNQAVGMYPTVILVLVALQRSHIEFQFKYDSPNNSMANYTSSMTFSRATQNDWRTSSTPNGGTTDILVTVQRRQCMTISEMPYEGSLTNGSSDSLRENKSHKVVVHRAVKDLEEV